MDSQQKQRKRYRRKGVRKRGPAQRKIGRPLGTFKDVDTAKLISDIARGVPIKIACAAVGIADHTFQNWVDDRPEFVQALAAKKQETILEWLGVVLTGTKEKEWRGAAWALEHVYPQYFAPQPQTPFGVQNNTFLISIEKAKEIEDQRTRLLPEVNRMLGITNGQNHESEPGA